MIALKNTPRCCPTKKYRFLGFIVLGNMSIWQIYECVECRHQVRSWFNWFDRIEEIKSSPSDNSRTIQSAITVKELKSRRKELLEHPERGIKLKDL